jgi:hypothetical protein
VSHGIAISKDALDAILGELRRRDERVDARYDKLMGMFAPLVPELFNAGKKDGRDVEIERFLATLTPEQMNVITQALGAEQSAMLFEIVSRYAFVPPVDPNKVEGK